MISQSARPSRQPKRVAWDELAVKILRCKIERCGERYDMIERDLREMPLMIWETV